MENPASIRDYDTHIDAPRHRTVAIFGAVVALGVATWAASYTVIPIGVAIISLF